MGSRWRSDPARRSQASSLGRDESNRDELGQGRVGSAMLGEGKSNGLRWRDCDDKARRVSEVSGSGS